MAIGVAKMPCCYGYAKKLVRPDRMIADTRQIEIDLRTIMKGFGYHPLRTLDETDEHASAPSDPRRGSIKGSVAVLLVAVILACIEREISGSTDGTLLSIFREHIDRDLHHFVSILLNSTPWWAR
jgi:hypothetical protein